MQGENKWGDDGKETWFEISKQPWENNGGDDGKVAWDEEASLWSSIIRRAFVAIGFLLE